MRVILTFVMLAVGVFSACGGDDGGGPSSSPPASPPAGSVAVPSPSPASAATYAPGTSTNQSRVDELIDAAASGDTGALLDRTIFASYTCDDLPQQSSHPSCSPGERLELFRFSAIEDQFRDRGGMRELYDGFVGNGAGLLAVYGAASGSSPGPASAFVVWLAPPNPEMPVTALYLGEDGSIVFLMQSPGGIDEGSMAGREVILPPR